MKDFFTINCRGIFLWIIVILYSTMIMRLAGTTENDTLVYIEEIIFFILLLSKWVAVSENKDEIIKLIVLIISLGAINCLMNQTSFITHLKLIFYILLFSTTYSLSKKEKLCNIQFLRKKDLYILCIFPYVLFAATGFDFFLLFPNSNVFVLLSVCLGLVWYLYSRKFYQSILISLVYILSNKTLGVVVAMSLAAVLIFVRDRRYIIIGLAFFVLGYFFIFNTDFTISVRIRNVLYVFSKLGFNGIFSSNTTYSDVYAISSTLKDSRGDDSSFLFRIMHWRDMIDVMIKKGNILTFLFGFGDDSPIKLTKSGLGPHNDYLKLLFEYGFFILVILCKSIYKLYKKIDDKFVKMFVLTCFIYYFSENLISHFISNSILYSCIGLYLGIKENKRANSII